LQRYDVGVVGAGPSGLLAARELAENGFRVIVFEEDRTVGRPERCAGLYSLMGLRLIRLPADGPYTQNRVLGATFIAPSGRAFTVKAGEDVAVVCNRERFDQYIAEEALAAGVQLRLGTHVKDAIRTCDGFRLVVGGEEIGVGYLIVAEGRRAHIARRVHPHHSLGQWIPIIQFQVAGHGLDPSQVYLYFEEYLPDFFAYLVPVDERVGKVGVAAMHNTWSLADRFLSDHFPKSRVIGISSSSIYVGPPMMEPVWDKAFLVGDVAGQVKATTGGGVVYGGLCGIAAARHIAGKMEFGKLAGPALRELKRTYLLRRIVSRLSPRTIEILFQAVAESGLSVRLGEVGDMERHLPTLLHSTFHWRGLSLAAHLLKAYIQTYLTGPLDRLKS
jgi:digeranylgeranylglycerophospholipid reductase